MSKDSKGLNSAFSDMHKCIMKASTSATGITGVPSGFIKLDEITSGWQNGELIVVGARTMVGKTAFVLSMLKQITIDYKIPALLFSPESSAKQVINRIMANVCEVPGEMIDSGKLPDDEWQVLDCMLQSLTDVPFYIDDTPSLKIDYLCDKAKEAVEQRGVRIIVIDYLQLLYNEVKYYENRYSELNYFTRRLKTLARELNVPIIITSQLNRNLEAREGCGENDKRPRLTDLRDSGTICDDCDMVVFIYRPEIYKIYTSTDGTDLRNKAEIIIAKHRNGKIGDVTLQFVGQYSRFCDLEEAWAGFPLS